MRVLIVEDDPMVLSINKGFVQKINPKNRIAVASNLKKAKAILLAEPIDLVLLDVYLGNDSGPDLLEWMRGEGHNADVILITADNSAETVSKTLKLGAVDYLIKPFTFGRFEEAIKAVIERNEKLKEGKSINQDAIDTLLKKQVDKNTGVEKGINIKTQDLIMTTLKTNGVPMTAQEVADSTELARVTVRRYLASMVDSGDLLETLQYGKIGRPQKYYKLRDD